MDRSAHCATHAVFGGLIAGSVGSVFSGNEEVDAFVYSLPVSFAYGVVVMNAVAWLKRTAEEKRESNNGMQADPRTSVR